MVLDDDDESVNCVKCFMLCFEEIELCAVDSVASVTLKVLIFKIKM